MDSKIAFIGAGNMARSLIQGMLQSGFKAEQIAAADPSAEQRASLADLGVKTVEDNRAIVTDADTTVLAVKPQVLVSVLQSLAPLPPKQLIISIAAGVPISVLARESRSDQPIIRCMPNTPALVGEGMTALFANQQTDQAARSLAERLLGAVGPTLWVESEEDIDAVTAVSGSGPAYFFYLMEAMIEAGQSLGLSQQHATQLTLQTALGAAKLAQSSAEEPATLRRNVTSPGGTTAAALGVMEEAKVSDAIVRALKQAAQRSQELAEHAAKSESS